MLKRNNEAEARIGIIGVTREAKILSSGVTHSRPNQQIINAFSKVCMVPGPWFLNMEKSTFGDNHHSPWYNCLYIYMVGKLTETCVFPNVYMFRRPCDLFRSVNFVVLSKPTRTLSTGTN